MNVAVSQSPTFEDLKNTQPQPVKQILHECIRALHLGQHASEVSHEHVHSFRVTIASYIPTPKLSLLKLLLTT